MSFIVLLISISLLKYFENNQKNYSKFILIVSVGIVFLDIAFVVCSLLGMLYDKIKTKKNLDLESPNFRRVAKRGSTMKKSPLRKINTIRNNSQRLIARKGVSIMPVEVSPTHNKSRKGATTIGANSMIMSTPLTKDNPKFQRSPQNNFLKISPFRKTVAPRIEVLEEYLQDQKSISQSKVSFIRDPSMREPESPLKFTPTNKFSASNRFRKVKSRFITVKEKKTSLFMDEPNTSAQDGAKKKVSLKSQSKVNNKFEFDQEAKVDMSQQDNNEEYQI